VQPATLRRAIADAIKSSELPRTLIAKDASLSRAALESWMSGLRNPSEQSAAQIAIALDQRAAILNATAARLRRVLAPRK
jgi:transcriptional regulator with XRE-family HTH domain